MKTSLLLLFSTISLILDAQTVPRGPKFTFLTPRAHDFGNVLLNANTTTRFTFRNTGDHVLVIKSMSGSAKGLNSPNYKMILSYPQSPVRPGDMGAIEVTFVAQGDTGNFRNRIFITSNATGANYPLLYVSGTIISEFEQPKPKQPFSIPQDFADSVINTLSH